MTRRERFLIAFEKMIREYDSLDKQGYFNDKPNNGEWEMKTLEKYLALPDDELVKPLSN